MKINNKILVAFLVSLGLFSVVQAAQYVKTLSSEEHGKLTLAAKSAGNVLLCEGAYDFVKVKRG